MSRRQEQQIERDMALARLILAELDWHALVDANQVAVGVEDNVVTVVGTVPSMAEKLVVIDTIESVEGVRDVISSIDVTPPDHGTDDAELSEMIEQMLRWDALVPDNDVHHRVIDGWVTLRGSVPTAQQRTEAERIVAHLLGVRGVSNELTLAAPTLSPAAIRETIVDALERHVAHQAGDISVVVEGQRVTLSGSVESGSEKRAVLGAVSHAPGVETVCEDLLVRPRPA